MEPSTLPILPGRHQTKILSHHLDFAPRPGALAVHRPLGLQALINRVRLIFVQPFRHSIIRIDPGP